MIEIFEYLVPAIGSVAIALLAWLLAWLIKNAKPILAVFAVKLATGLFDIAVNKVNQKYVEELKLKNEDGELTSTEKKEAFNMALNLFLSLAGPFILNLLKDTWGSRFEENIEGGIEAAVYKNKSTFLPDPIDVQDEI